jgi:hypothetical protein
LPRLIPRKAEVEGTTRNVGISSVSGSHRKGERSSQRCFFLNGPCVSDDLMSAVNFAECGDLESRSDQGNLL